jgi:hypothetical protein
MSKIRNNVHLCTSGEGRNHMASAHMGGKCNLGAARVEDVVELEGEQLRRFRNATLRKKLKAF